MYFRYASWRSRHLPWNPTRETSDDVQCYIVQRHPTNLQEVYARCNYTKLPSHEACCLWVTWWPAFLNPFVCFTTTGRHAATVWMSCLEVDCVWSRNESLIRGGYPWSMKSKDSRQREWRKWTSLQLFHSIKWKKVTVNFAHTGDLVCNAMRVCFCCAPFLVVYFCQCYWKECSIWDFKDHSALRVHWPRNTCCA